MTTTLTSVIHCELAIRSELALRHGQSSRIDADSKEESVVIVNQYTQIHSSKAII